METNPSCFTTSSGEQKNIHKKSQRWNCNRGNWLSGCQYFIVFIYFHCFPLCFSITHVYGLLWYTPSMGRTRHCRDDCFLKWRVDGGWELRIVVLNQTNRQQVFCFQPVTKTAVITMSRSVCLIAIQSRNSSAPLFLSPPVFTAFKCPIPFTFAFGRSSFHCWTHCRNDSLCISPAGFGDVLFLSGQTLID